MKLTAPQTELLAAIGRGEVAHRYHFKCGWAARWHTLNGQRLTSSGPGGGMGRCVDAATLALIERGLAVRQEGPRPYADHPYALTDAGREAITTALTGEGMLGLWRLPEDVEKAVRAQLDAIGSAPSAGTGESP